MEKKCETCGLSYRVTGKNKGSCFEVVGVCEAYSKWQPKEDTMKYRVLKEISLLTLAQAGPKGCGEFDGQYFSLLSIANRQKAATFELSLIANNDEPICNPRKWFLEWAEDYPTRIAWLIEQGFIERVDPPFEPVTITLSSQEMVDKAYALLRYNPILCAVGDNIYDPLWKVWEAQLGSYTKNDEFYFNKLRNAWNRRA